MQKRLRFGNGHGGNRKHDWARKRKRRGERRVPGLDPCSSGPWFDGWARAWRGAVRESVVAGRASPTALARGPLLRFLWRRHGLLEPDERPVGAL